MKNQCKDHGINAMVMGSVLNVVIDHAMEEITPMDTEEWNSKIRNGETENENIGTKHILVPVIRIFGPLKKANGYPLQSCCLYVHGAFPYFLARPVIAGPDGSLYPASSMSTHVNWDNRHEVETIQGEIQATLEDQLQSSFLDKGFGEKENDSMCKRDPEKGQCAIVRKVTIVEGRGFYTFCPGPTTVFLRVEYYDPKLRWKVKLAMERGLQLPQKYHPDCKRYDRVATDDTNDLLRFNCYEAHVPYTMQFFKDNNLAGMKFVHVLNGRIRGKLPRTISKNFICSKKKSVDNFLFLQSNTPINDFWPKQDDDRDEFSSFCNLRSDYTPPQKNTTCDVELDCTVNEISGMTLDQDESGTIQWRAVPNLREIWKEERARMKILLSPEATQEVVRDVLSNDKSIDPDEQVLKSKPFTLNTDNENSPKSGTKLATRGMWSLVNVSNGLQDDFIRSLTDILERHKETILKFDEQLQKGGRKMIDLDRTKQNLRYEERKEFFSQLATPGSNEKDFNLDGITPPTMKEAISALKSLGAQNLDSEFKAVGSSQSSSSPVNEAINAPGLMTPSTAEELKHGEELKHRESTLSFMPQFYESKTCKKIASCEINLPDLLTKGSSSLIRYNKADVADSDYVFPGSNATQNEFDEQNNSQVLKAHSFDEEEREDHISTSLLQPGGQCIGTNDFISQRSRMFSQSLTYSSSQEIHENSMSESFNPVEFSQRMERGDSVLNTQYQDIEDLIDPDTLAPYEQTFFGEGCCRAIFAVDTDLNDMKRICGLNDGSCSREGHKFADNRARPGIYSTISTGGIVDGKMHDFLSKADDEDEDCELLEDFCQRSQNFLDTPPPKPQLEIATPIANSIFTQINDEFNLENAQRDLTSYEDGSDGDENVHIKAQTVTVGNITKQSIDKKKDNGNEYLSNTISHERILLVAPKREQVKSWNLKLKRKQTDKSSTNPRRNRKLNNLHKANNVDGCNSLNFDSNKAALKGHEKKSQRIKNGKEKLHQTLTESQEPSQNALDGICNQGGRIFLEGGGGLKAKTKVTNTITSSDEQCYQNQNLPTTPVTILIVEVHVQCRVGSSRLDSTKISMTQDSNKDMITAIVYVHARDHGGGESIEVLSRGCICLTLEGENPNKDRKINKNVELQLLRSMPRSNIGVESPLSIEVVKDERYLLRRFKDIVRIKDPDLMLSWDTQGAGIGYIIERGHSVGNPSTSSVNVVSKDGLDMAKLLGRTPMDKKIANIVTMIPGGKSKQLNVEQEVGGADASHEQMWRGSGLGADWDERVGAGAAAASIVGRIVLSGWKIISEEVKHPNSSYLPAIVHSVLNKRIPHHDNLLLTKWYARSTERWRVLNYKLTVAISSLLIFDRLDIIGRAGEAARLSGVEFSQSFPGIRGSQYKVEGVLLRALQSLHSDERGSKKGKKAESGFSTQSSSISNESTTSKSQSQSPWKVRRANYRQNESPGSDDRKYFFFSPSQEDTKKQEALEVQALTLEPQSGHFTHPVVVCDFTALYPSLIIAYNLCYSTCAGKLDYHSTREEMQMEGKTTSKIGPFFYSEQRTSTVLNHHLKSVSNALYSGVNNRQVIDFSNDRVYVSPTGTIYLSESVLKGVLPQVLDEMLTTRAMLKRAAKQYKKHVKNLSPAVLRQLEARQLALKYVANVTYGYTSATFSGRCAMPLLADTIVECGRRTLQKAVNVANQWGKGTDPWGKKDLTWYGAKVIYGDTDSLFIELPNKTKDESFEFGEKFVAAVTSLNPPPIQLKLEKVYVGSLMQTMKRYCGMKFDSKDQKKPTFEAKGLETIRRDQCTLTQKVLKNALTTLFKHDMQAVKEYLYRQWSLIFAGELPVSDFILTGRVRSKYRGGKEGPVQAVLARRLGEADPGRMTKHKQRLSYVIVATPGVNFRLKDCVLTPRELLERWDAYKIHAGYYIEKHVNAALQRCLGLPPHFINVSEWFAVCPKPRRRTHFWPIKSKRAMITAYFGNDVCSLCQRKCQADGRRQVVVCKSCRNDGINSIQSASIAINVTEHHANRIAKKCSACNGCFEGGETFAAVAQQTLSDSGKISHSLLMPLANCVCIDCPTTYQRHRLREQGIEANGVYETLTYDTAHDDARNL